MIAAKALLSRRSISSKAVASACAGRWPPVESKAEQTSRRSVMSMGDATSSSHMQWFSTTPISSQVLSGGAILGDEVTSDKENDSEATGNVDYMNLVERRSSQTRTDTHEAKDGKINTSVLENQLAEMIRVADEATISLQQSASPAPHDLISVLNLWATISQQSFETGLTKSKVIRGVPQRAENLISWWEITQPSLILRQQVDAMNEIIRAWAYSNEYLRGTNAERAFHKITNPNDKTFRLIIRAWCWSKEHRCAFTATGHFIRMMKSLVEGSNNIDMKPSLDDYHVLFDAWTRAGDKNAPSKVQAVLEIIENAYNKGQTDVRPDLACYRDSLITMSLRLNAPDVGDLADSTLSTMKERLIIPDSKCYSAAICAWKNVAIGRECIDRNGAAVRAFSLLRDMTQAYQRTTEVEVKATTVDYNNVLEALSAVVSRGRRVTEKAKTLLDAMEVSMKGQGDDEASDDSLHPNARSYGLLIEVWGKSKLATRVEEASKVLDRLKLNSQTVLAQPDTTEESCIEAFSSFIKVCAGSPLSNNSGDMDTFKVAMKSVEDLQGIGLQPSSSIYASLLEACRHLIPEGKDRQLFVESIFHKCCQEGFVDQMVMEKMQLAASGHAYARIVIAKSEELEDMKVVPELWTRNVKGFLANSKQGRKVLPLTIEGKFTFTKAAAEYKMRKLRQKTNKQVLQGGRS